MNDEPVREVREGDGYAVAHLDGLGDGYGFRKIRKSLGVTAFGVNAIVQPKDYPGNPHFHETQEELYFVHRGHVRIEFGDGTSHVLDEGGLARVDAGTVRAVVTLDEDATLVVVGGKDGYVGRDGRPPESKATAGSG
jgi:mannose-6-phosphate isomerase-like protein (cupin superfamily)